jgi:hypothetical protein
VLINIDPTQDPVLFCRHVRPGWLWMRGRRLLLIWWLVRWKILSSVACAAALRPADSSCHASAWDISSSSEICCTVRPARLICHTAMAYCWRIRLMSCWAAARTCSIRCSRAT